MFNGFSPETVDFLWGIRLNNNREWFTDHKKDLYKDGKAMPTEITTGIRTEKEVQVLKGLNIGDTVIVSGTLQLRTGLNVSLDNVD